MNRLLTLSAPLVLALGVAAPAASATSAGAAAPAHRLDVMIKHPGDRHWVGKGVHGSPAEQRITGVLRSSPGRTVAVVRIVNTGTQTGELDISASSIREAFYGGAHWPRQTMLDPGESVTFRYVGHRGSAEDGDSMPVDITAGDDGVRFLLVAR